MQHFAHFAHLPMTYCTTFAAIVKGDCYFGSCYNISIACIIATVLFILTSLIHIGIKGIFHKISILKIESDQIDLVELQIKLNLVEPPFINNLLLSR